MAGRVRLGIDIGGTFTDFIAVDDDSGQVHTWKTLTTPADPAIAVIEGMAGLLQAHDIDPAEVDALIHATTLITNSLIERKGARTALVTTAGFPDLIEIGREVRYDLYDLFLKMPEPLVPRELRFEVRERTGHTGEVLAVPDRDALRELAARLVDAGVESVAVCFLHSYANPANERLAADALAEHLPHGHVSISSEVAGEIREYERFSTTAANAYVQPLAGRYLRGLEERIADSGVPAPLRVMLSNGGTTTVEEAARLPVRLVESGPAAGALIGAHYARLLDEPLVLAFDMGGTTAKLCAIEDGRPTIGSGLEVARVHRFKRGSGLPIRAPSVELIEIGAGGGSIARVDELGLLTIGPDSAGADPGPACYGQGGDQPTVTDADLLLGYLDPDFFLGGAMTLDREAAERAVACALQPALALDPLRIAAGISDIVNENMATAAGVYIAERGQDPRRFTLVATGGAGPVHAVEVARKLGIAKVVVPPSAGVASAGGLLVAPPRLDFARSRLARLDELEWDEVEQLFAAMENEALRTLAGMGIASGDIEVERSVDARYVNQGHEFPVPIPSGIDRANARELLGKAFEEVYTRLFGRTVPGVPVECVTWRAAVRGRDGSLPAVPTQPRATAQPRATRPVYFPAQADAVVTPVYRREALPSGCRIDGPAIIEEAQSTIVAGPADRCEVDVHGNVIVHVGERGAL